MELLISFVAKIHYINNIIKIALLLSYLRMIAAVSQVLYISNENIFKSFY